jgi:predicted DNA-binding antitoxin AbrB/MazE fold protein
LKTIRAIYENGVLRPLAELPYPDRTEVVITIETVTEARNSDKEEESSNTTPIASVHQAFEAFSRRAA